MLKSLWANDFTVYLIQLELLNQERLSFLRMLISRSDQLEDMLMIQLCIIKQNSGAYIDRMDVGQSTVEASHPANDIIVNPVEQLFHKRYSY